MSRSNRYHRRTIFGRTVICRRRGKKRCFYVRGTKKRKDPNFLQKLQRRFKNDQQLYPFRNIRASQKQRPLKKRVYPPTSDMVVLYKDIPLRYERPRDNNVATFQYTEGKYRSSSMKPGESISFTYNGDHYTRYHINSDGRCLFDSLSFLFLFYKQTDVKMRTKKCWLEDKGWNPKIGESHHDTNGEMMTTKGNLMEILFRNIDDIVAQLTNAKKYDADFFSGNVRFTALEEFKNWVDMMHDRSNNNIPGVHDFPNYQFGENILPFMFDEDRYKLCFFYANPRNGDVDCVIDVGTPCVKEYNKTTLYIWFTSDHFEPVLRTIS